MNARNIFILTIFFFSCFSPKKKCLPTHGKAVLVAFKISKHSWLWFENPITKKIHAFNSLGGRRKPTINLGDTIQVQYCDEDLLINKFNYVQQTNESTEFYCLNNFWHLKR